MPQLGLASSGLIHLGVPAGVWVTLRLRRAPGERLPRTGAERRPPPASAATRAFGLAPPLLLPPIFFAAWTVLLPGRTACIAARRHSEGLALPPLVLGPR